MVTDFQFTRGSMRFVVGKKIIHLIEYTTSRSLPIIMVCVYRGAHIQKKACFIHLKGKID